MPEHGERGDQAHKAEDSQTAHRSREADDSRDDNSREAEDSQTGHEEHVRGLAEPETLVDGADDLEDEADLGSRLSMAASDPPSSWAGSDVPPSNKAR